MKTILNKDYNHKLKPLKAIHYRYFEFTKTVECNYTPIKYGISKKNDRIYIYPVDNDSHGHEYPSVINIGIISRNIYPNKVENIYYSAFNKEFKSMHDIKEKYNVIGIFKHALDNHKLYSEFTRKTIKSILALFLTNTLIKR